MYCWYLFCTLSLSLSNKNVSCHESIKPKVRIIINHYCLLFPKKKLKLLSYRFPLTINTYLFRNGLWLIADQDCL